MVPIQLSDEIFGGSFPSVGYPDYEDCHSFQLIAKVKQIRRALHPFPSVHYVIGLRCETRFPCSLCNCSML
jgi:hypothetical protein